MMERAGVELTAKQQAAPKRVRGRWSAFTRVAVPMKPPALGVKGGGTAVQPDANSGPVLQVGDWPRKDWPLP
jgi:hypothetical protein